jgi:hypothetical protein
MEFQEQLKAIGYNPKTYLQQAQIKSMFIDYDWKMLQFSDDDKYKLQIINPANGKIIRFGATGYNDYLIYMFLVKKRKITYEEAQKHRENFLKRMKKTNDKLYSKKNLSRNILW